MLVWAASLFYAYPGAYRTMRDTNCLTLPYPGYLQRLLVKIGNDDPGLGPSQIAFLKEKFKLLEQNQKTVAILLDEIYVASRIVYKGGKIFGLTEESNNPSDITAQTLQAFMYHSVQEKNKDVIALFPVRSITAEILYKLVRPVLKVMEEVGFRVLCLIADDNQVNAKMFKMLGDGTLKTCVPHPFNKEEKLFLLFDQVHLFKNVRNNWINAPAKLFKIPHISLDKGDLALIRVSDVETMEARFSDIIDLFNADKRNIAKLAPKLSRKSVFPSSVERQNVQLVVNVFHDTTIQALETLKKDGKINISDGTIMLLKLLVRWWKISNVKNAFKGTRLNDVCCELVRNSGDPNSKDWKLSYLREFKKFLEVWNSLAGDGKLTNQTYTALVHTITATLELVEYVFTKYGFADMLLGKLQTDNVEGRFGGYRRMSGSNYHVSVEQVCESERKLKLLGILRMKSDRGEEFSIKTFGEDCEKEAKELKTEENLEFFKLTIQEKQTVSVSLNNLRVLVCLASYAATKVIQHFSKTKSEICSDCVSMLITTELLEIERAEEIYSYLSGIDRGGLNKPSDFSFNLCVNIFKLFSKLISSKYESQFLKLQSPRRAIVSLGLQMCKNAINDAAPCPNCDLSLEKIIKKILRTLANCFLKNYAKNLQESNTARLLAIQYSKKATKEKKKKQEKTPTEKSCAESEETVTTSVPVAVATGKFKDPIERKLVKLNPVRLTVTTPKTDEAVQKYACDVNLTADQLITFKNLASNSNAASSNVKLSVPEMLGRIGGQMCEQVSSKNRAIGNKENLGPIKLPNQISDYAGDVTKAMKRTAEDYRDVRSTKVMKVVMKQEGVLKDTSNTAGEKQLKVVRVIPAQQRLALIQNQPTTTTANLQKPPERQALKKSTNTLR
ncbi:unnamed protein product [Bemisia tabaci]|uniref:Transposable element P transposase-like RNase H domain-containing protein n=1 Tax=Bemisia tabaci TaxID=7038 RepID=A0A9P0CA15_BEMTA|nr:unnamed protein product [Bemisia tabaci]